MSFSKNLETFHGFLADIRKIGLDGVLAHSTKNALSLRIENTDSSASLTTRQTQPSAHQSMLSRKIEHMVIDIVEKGDVANALRAIADKIESASLMTTSAVRFRLAIRHCDEGRVVFTSYPGKYNARTKEGPTLLRHFGHNSTMMRDLWLLGMTPSHEGLPSWTIRDGYRAWTYFGETPETALIRHHLCVPGAAIKEASVSNQSQEEIAWDYALFEDMLEKARLATTY